MSKSAVFQALRNKLLSLSHVDVKITPGPSGVWGVLMDFAVDATWVTLVAILDGTTSMYIGSGGGFIGAGGRDTVRKANKQFLAAAERFVGSFEKTTAFPTADRGKVRFYVLKADGVYASGEVDEKELVERRSDLAPLYIAAQDVITQIRLATPPK